MSGHVPVHAVRIDSNLVADNSPRPAWRFWCLCGEVGTWKPTFQDAERESWTHLTIQPARRKPPTPRLPKGPR